MHYEMSNYPRNQISIRKVIELLCKILDENGVCSVKAETFRKAKFNEDEVAFHLWELVYKVLCYIGETKLLTAEVKPEDVANFTKTKLLEKQYISKELLNLSNDLSQGSRELLLAFGWLLYEEQLICKLIFARTNVFDDSNKSLLSVFDINTGMLPRNQYKSPKIGLQNETSDPFIKIQQLLILNNKLRLNLCNLYSFQKELFTLKHKIYNATSVNHGANNNDCLTILELQLLKSPEKLKKYLDLLEKDNKCLENFLSWKHCQEVFWEWMGTVLDLKLSESPVDQHAELPKDFFQLQSNASNKLSETYKDLENIMSEYDQILNHLEKLCLEKPNGIPTEELDSIVSIIEVEIRKYKIILNNNYQQFAQKPDFKMESKNEHVIKQNTDQTNGNLLDILKEGPFIENFKEVDIQNETTKLKNEISNLEACLMIQKNKLRNEMDHLNSKMNEYYCIPPPKKPQLK